jgi:DNA-binding NtrC family response regulator
VSPLQKVKADIDRSRSPAIQTVIERLRKIAKTDSPLTLLGETGVGKTTLGELVHEGSYRRGAAFISVNAALLNGELAASTIFGADPGSYTGCRTAIVGILEKAHRGTVLIDEVTTLSLETQAMLLRAIDDKRGTAIGGRTYEADVRIICATNDDLTRAVKQGRFREDLYHRIARFVIRVPPLRERREDLRGNVAACLRKLGVERAADDVLLPGAWALLEAHPLRGNFRELESLLHRALVFGDGERIDAPDLHADEEARDDRRDGAVPMTIWPELSGPKRARPTKLAPAELEELYMRKDAGEGEKALMVRFGISRATLYRYMQQRPKR